MKKRRTRVLIPGLKVIPDEIVIGAEGTIELLSNGRKIESDQPWVETFYDRPNKPKILNRVKITSASLATDPNSAISNFTDVLAVDTGTLQLDSSTKLSVGCLFHCKIHDHHQASFAVTWGPRLFVAIRNARVGPEELGAMHLLALAKLLPEVKDQSVAAVIDFNLRMLAALNKNQSLFSGGPTLPSDWQFFYATSDGGSEYLVNRLLRRVDREAKRLSDRLRVLSNLDEHVPLVHSSFCDGVAVWLSEPKQLVPLQPAFV